MENFDFECIQLSLKDAVNETLGDVAKDSIESNNYHLLHAIAKIGIDVNSFLDGLFLSYSSIEHLPLIEAELVNENNDEP